MGQLLKTATGRRLAWTLALAAGAVGTPQGRAQDQTAAQPAAPARIQTSSKLAAAPPVTYDNKYEIYGGLQLQTFRAGQNLPKFMNLGGIEVMGTRWLSDRWGAAAEFRGGAGTTDPLASTGGGTRPLVVLYTGMGGVQYRGPKSQRAALDFHALAGISHGDFNQTPLPSTPGSFNDRAGLYTNRNAAMAVVGGSVDLNRSKNLAFRISPDLVLEHFGDNLREFFSISGGVIYRFGSR